jgi:histidinol-phosphatase (PHP family)
MKILVGFETESYSGAFSAAETLIAKYRPDYIVGSVHHVDDINFDFDDAHYRNAVRAVGGVDDLYHRYFDIQYDMITRLRPGVVGHFDLVRLFDPEYPERLQRPDIQKKIDRNLSAVKDLGLILDLNLRALHKGAKEPYPAGSILQEALKMDIQVIPGDDSHGVKTVGNYIEKGIGLLEKMGFDTRWDNMVGSITTGA